MADMPGSSHAPAIPTKRGRPGASTMQLRTHEENLPEKCSGFIARTPLEPRLAVDHSHRYVLPMARREKLDPSWHKSRIAARIWMKGLQGRRLTAREKRLARLFSEDRGVENRLIQQGIFYFIG